MGIYIRVNKKRWLKCLTRGDKSSEKVLKKVRREAHAVNMCPKI